MQPIDRGLAAFVERFADVEYADLNSPRGERMRSGKSGYAAADNGYAHQRDSRQYARIASTFAAT
jgi:hypothetical protein